MTKKERRGGLSGAGNVDPAVSEWQKNAAENKAALTNKQKRDRARKDLQVKLDLASPLRKAALELIAEQEQTSVSQAGNLLLAWAMTRYFEGDAEIRDAFYEGHEPARTPRFVWNVQEPETWARLLDNFAAYGDVDGDA